MSPMPSPYSPVTWSLLPVNWSPNEQDHIADLSSPIWFIISAVNIFQGVIFPLKIISLHLGSSYVSTWHFCNDHWKWNAMQGIVDGFIILKKSPFEEEKTSLGNIQSTHFWFWPVSSILRLVSASLNIPDRSYCVQIHPIPKKEKKDGEVFWWNYPIWT